MHLRIILSIIISGFLLHSCYIADELFEVDTQEESEETRGINLQRKAERNIALDIHSKSDSATYTPFGFSQLSVVKPLAIENLESWEAQYKRTPGDTALAGKIERQKAFIRENRIERTAKLEHFFTLSDDSTGITILEVEYTLNDTLGVKSTTPKIILNVPEDYELVINYYFNEYTIIIAQTYSEGLRMSRALYRFFKTQLETYTTVSEKSNFLKHILDICKMVKLKGNFDQDFIVQSILKSYVKKERTDIQDYEALKFSELYETRNNTDDSVVGYYFFHKFIGNYESQKDTNVVLVEFSPYYEVDQIFQLEGTFESYTKQTK